MKWWLWFASAALLPWASRAETVESAPWGPFTVDTRTARQCLATVGPDEAAAGRAIWDLTGLYSTAVNGNPLSLDLVHDTKGKLSGTAILTLDTGKTLMPLRLPIRGNVRGAAGVLAVTLTLQGADASGSARAALVLKLALDREPARLTGMVTGSLTVNGTSTPLPQPLTLTIPASMTGAWTLDFDLVWNRGGAGGTALLTLSNGIECVHTVTGKYTDQAAVLTLWAQPGARAVTGNRIRTTIAPLEGAPARMTAFSGTLYGQTVAW
jgi:hypothetical protein